MNKKRMRSRDEEEYTAFLKHIREEREETSNFAKSLLTFVLGVCCVLVFGLWFVQNDNLVISIFGEDSPITQQLLAIGHVIKSHTRSSNSWSLFGRQQNILLLGVDSNGNNSDTWKGTRSDTIILMNIDPATHSVNAISIPRDSKVYLPDKYGVDKINAAHAYGGIDMAKQTIEKTLGVKIDKYICVHDEGVREVIDALGGIPIYVEKRMKYDDYAGHLHINLDKGNHVLSGQQAVGYLRFRHDGLGDIGRTQRQQWFLRGFLERLQNPQIISKIPQIVNISKKYIKTDMSLYELSQLAALAKGFDESNLRYMRLFYQTFKNCDTLRHELTWSHYRMLLRVKDETARNWYMNEAANQTWSTRQLDRQISVLYYERLLASQDKKVVQIEAKIKLSEIEPQQFIHDPYVLEFLNLKNYPALHESTIEQALIDNIQHFLGKPSNFVVNSKYLGRKPIFLLI